MGWIGWWAVGYLWWGVGQPRNERERDEHKADCGFVGGAADTTERSGGERERRPSLSTVAYYSKSRGKMRALCRWTDDILFPSGIVALSFEAIACLNNGRFGMAKLWKTASSPRLLFHWPELVVCNPCRMGRMDG